jgi:hypothetical protein
MINGTMNIGQITFQDDGTHLNVSIQLLNPTTRTLHTYANVRRIQYDPATRVLNLELSDQNTSPPPFITFFRLPDFTSVDPNGQTTITLSLPRSITQLAPGENVPSPQLASLPIHEAATVQAEVGWSDTPFYPDTRDTKRSIQEQLVAWQKGIARGRGGAEPPPPVIS